MHATPSTRVTRPQTAGHSAALKDQLVCDLELQRTVAAAKIEHLEKIRDDLEVSRDTWAFFYERSPMGHIILDERGYIANANFSAADLLNSSREGLIHLPFSFVVHPDDTPKWLEHLLRCKQTGQKVVRTDLRLRSRVSSENGKPSAGRRAVPEHQIVPVEMMSVPYLGPKGKRMLLTGLINQAERQRKDEALAEAKEFSEAIIETINQPIVVLDADLHVISVNRAFSNYFQRPAKYVQGRVFDVLLNLWWSGNKLRSDIERVLVRNEPIESLKLEIEPPLLGRRILRLSARPLYRKRGTAPLVLVVLEDITDRELAREELRKLNEELEHRVAARTEALRRSNEQMEAFCYSIAHDLRAPLRGMTGFSHLLAERFASEIGDEGRGYTDRIQKSAARMDRLIQDLLQYGRLNTIDLPVQEVSLEQVFAEVVAQLDREIEERRASIHKREVLPPVLGNHVVLHVVLSNLISNALKFVPPDTSPEVTVRAEHARGATRLWVVDNGIGIAPESQEKIFGVFHRLHSGDRYPGTGIGLALVSKGMERIGGRVGVESEPGKGSRFWIEMKKPA